MSTHERVAELEELRIQHRNRPRYQRHVAVMTIRPVVRLDRHDAKVLSYPVVVEDFRERLWVDLLQEDAAWLRLLVVSVAAQHFELDVLENCGETRARVGRHEIDIPGDYFERRFEESVGRGHRGRVVWCHRAGRLRAFRTRLQTVAACMAFLAIVGMSPMFAAL